jgi:hypothetical protein
MLLQTHYMNPHLCAQVTFDKGAKTVQWTVFSLKEAGKDGFSQAKEQS